MNKRKGTGIRRERDTWMNMKKKLMRKTGMIDIERESIQNEKKKEVKL